MSETPVRKVTETSHPAAGTGPFDTHPEFYLEDNRQHRGLHPITKTSLEAKCGCLLPEWLVKDKTILDLGSCLGAAGHWALHYGASCYVGIEIQTEYAKRSAELLANWGERAKIVNANVRDYLRETPPQSFDVVVAAGVLYLFIDPKTIIDEICRVAYKAVVIESAHPKSVVDGHIPPRSLVTEYRKQGVNLAGSLESLLGISGSATLPALDLFFALNGFFKREEQIDFPRTPETVVYTEKSLTTAGLPPRFAVRYLRSTSTAPLTTLEQNLPTKSGARRDWRTSPTDVRQTTRNTEASKNIARSHQPWAFDAEVAARFDRIAETSIPNYRQVIHKTVQIINKRNYSNPKIIDVGCATGNTLRKLYEAGFQNLFGVDSSAEMLGKSFDRANLIHSERFPTERGPFEVVIANWVLHFIRERESYLKSIADSLSPNGMVIISEKIQSSEFIHELYHDFKRANGLSEVEIAEKQRRLVSVLVPYPIEWYFITLKTLGFESIEIVDSAYSFVTMVASRRPFLAGDFASKSQQ